MAAAFNVLAGVTWVFLFCPFLKNNINYLKEIMGKRHRMRYIRNQMTLHPEDTGPRKFKKWRWRMLGAALLMINAIPPLDRYDGIIVTDLFNLADFKALVGQPCPPVLAYFHENQITYPQTPGDKGAFQLGIINITTALAADHPQKVLEAVQA